MKANRMWQLAFVLLVLGPSSRLWGQNWQVIEVGGNVQSEVLKRKVKVGDALPQPTGLQFAGPEAFVLLYHPQRGRRLLPFTYQRPAPAGLDACAKAKQLANAQRGTVCLLVDTLTKQLANGRFLVVGDLATIDLYFEQPLLRHALTEVRFWLAVPQNADTLWHQLAFNSDPRNPDYLLTLERQQLYPTTKNNTSGQRRPGTAGLVLEDFNGERYWVLGLEPVWPEDQTALRQGLQQLIDRERKAGRKGPEIRRSIEHWLATEYGTPLEQNLVQWLQQSFALSLD